MIRLFRRSFVTSSLLLSACGGAIASEEAPDPITSEQEPDGGAAPSSRADAGVVDASPDARIVDASAPDVAPPDAGTVKLGTVTSWVSFGRFAVGTQSGSVAIDVANRGTAVSSPIAAVLNGTGADAFVVSSDTCTGVALSPGEECTVRIAYAPTTDGSHEAVWSVIGQPLAVVGLDGEAYTSGVLSASTTLLDFGEQPLGVPGNHQSFTVTNEGPGTVVGIKTTVEGADAADFLPFSCAYMLAPGESCVSDIEYFPHHHRGVESAEAVFAFDGKTQLRVPLRGRALAPAHFTGVTSVDFDDVAVGTSVRREITLTNDGDEENGTSLAVVEGNLRFLVAQNGCSHVAGGASCLIAVDAKPRSAGPMNATLRVLLPGASVTELDITLTARALATP
ncbi:hypothetical protein AKJ09_07995 [Labilithrix luteola]|uniref:Abnormal spindle-like microcephaly-associated protein ASH domain-containing protein n=1 Tax=Labilithrix luteola TaxID=1391654 RepID=A0A0K1Q6Q9_9BACT|nr:choice-of-anchor D domain-containing protein [Labilithrix luteola]AKV01332.1 hypothetical protein AKJ09_07995 [Labilithrix luteola]